MPVSLSAADLPDDPADSRGRRLARHAAVAWLLVIQPVVLALALDRSLPRLASFGAAEWLVVAVRVALAAAGIAIARRLRAPETHAWRAVSLWFVAAIAATLLERVWPVWPTSLAPSEARLAALAAVVRDAVLALVAAWLARAGTTVAVEPPSARDSS